MTRLKRIGVLVLAAMSCIAVTQVQAGEQLSDGELDSIVAGFLDAEINLGNVSATSGDSGQSCATSIGGGVCIPVHNGFQPDSGGGDMAAGNQGGDGSLDKSNHSRNTDAGRDAVVGHDSATIRSTDVTGDAVVGYEHAVVRATDVGGDAVVSHDSSTPRFFRITNGSGGGTSSPTGTNVPERETGSGGGSVAVAYQESAGGTATSTVDNSDNSRLVFATGNAAVANENGTATLEANTSNPAVTTNGHGNTTETVTANGSSAKASTTKTLSLSGEAQHDATALYLINTLGQVGNGFNMAATVNSSGGGAILNANLNSATITDQTILNFSNMVSASRTVSLTPTKVDVIGATIAAVGQ